MVERKTGMDPSVAESLVAQALLELASEKNRIAVIDVAEKAGVSISLTCTLLRSIEEKTGGLLGIDPGCDDVSVSDFFALALSLVSNSIVAPEKAAKLLDWRDFEAFAAIVFQNYGYHVFRGVYKPPPMGFEVDVVAVSPSLRYGIVVDCKHWDPRYSSPSRLRRAAIRHAQRTRLLAQFWSMARNISRNKKPRAFLPILIVLRENVKPLVEGVPVIPASKLRGFMEKIEYLLEDPRVRLIRWE